ncbi:hypothetical protein LOAG_08732 [Loa loa]|uniref:Protein YIPF n=2 Tax=Loa loa TaxID=7209 RepID=A0A1S0TT95_LOALO|nr:hypothetical protein LOAG_08732 [Loa loa]EFO19763.2 hypothetical protein LOAG_08732 [Loa loa]
MSDTVSSSHLSPISIVNRGTTTVPATENILVNLAVSQSVYSHPSVELGAEFPPNLQMAHSFGNAAIDIELLEKEISAKEQERRNHQYNDLSGEIVGVTSSKTRRSGIEPGLNNDFDTLDEPVWDTVRRDLHTVFAKFGQVMVPKSSQQLLRDWDLWGPLFLCVFISLMLQGGKSGKGPHFTEVFMLTFFGSCVVTLNTKLIGGNISFFQSLCVLGYCLLPPGLAAVVCKFIEINSEQTAFLFALRLLVTTAGFIWAIYASMLFISGSQPPRRKMLALYPIFLFYFVVSWMIISHSSF